MVFISVRANYAKVGVENYYKQQAYRNPHEPLIREVFSKLITEWKLVDSKALDNVCDLACGDGLISLEVLKAGGKVTGVDPYLGKQYKERVGAPFLEMDFAQIAEKGLGKQFSLVVASYALHLCPSSLIEKLIWALSNSTKQLLVISPNNRPKIKEVYVMKTNELRTPCKVRLYEPH